MYRTAGRTFILAIALESYVTSAKRIHPSIRTVDVGYPDWRDCSYEDTRTPTTCGRKISFLRGGGLQYRWLHPGQAFGEVDGSALPMDSEGVEMSTRITVDSQGFVVNSTHKDFFSFGNELSPLLGWRTYDIGSGVYNVNACPITYGSQRHECVGDKAPRAYSLQDYPPEKKVIVILDTDIGVFMDDPFALVFAAAHPRLDLNMVVTTSRNTADSTLIVAKFLWEVSQGRPNVTIAAGVSNQPDEEHLLVPWARQPPDGWAGDADAWARELHGMVRQPETAGSPTTAAMIAERVSSLRRSGIISREQPLVYWMIGPATTLVQVQASLSEEDKACVLLVTMGGSMVPGSRLFFGPSAGFTPWAETNVKGDDVAPFGRSTDTMGYTEAVQDLGWAGVMVGLSETVCDATPGAGDTYEAWGRFAASTSGTSRLMMNMLRQWDVAAVDQCKGKYKDSVPPLKCAPLNEAEHLAESNWAEAPVQCDLMSIMPFLEPQRFLLEPKFLTFKSSNGEHNDKVGGCTLQSSPPPGKRCLVAATGYRSPHIPVRSHGDIKSRDAHMSRDKLLSDALDLLAL